VKLRAPFNTVAAAAWLVLFYLALPILIVFPVSLTDSRVLELPRDGISFRHWRDLFGDPQWLGSFEQSLAIALAATALAVAAGTLSAIGCWRVASRVGEAMRALMLLPIIVPSIIYAVALYRYYAELKMLGTYLGVILAHAILGLPYVTIAVTASLANFDRRLEQAARNLGANMWQVVSRIIVPNIVPGMLSGAIFAFVASWDELVVVLFVASRTIFTLPRIIWDGINESLDPKIAVVASAMIAVTAALLVAEQLIYLWRRRISGSTAGRQAL
jgi:putative spermidine/putrescine transport system permease protein